ncbi:MAG: type II secretion system protein [bacterium]
MEKNKKTSKGFTLVELLVFVAILAIVSVTVTVSYRETAKKEFVYSEAQKLAQFIRKAQNNTVNGIECVEDPVYGNGPTAPNCITDKPPEWGYAVLIDESLSNIARMRGNFGNSGIVAEEDPIVEVLTLDTDTSLSPGSISKGVVFERPYGNPIYRGNHDPWIGDCAYTVEYANDPRDSYYVYINGESGRIFISDDPSLEHEACDPEFGGTLKDGEK